MSYTDNPALTTADQQPQQPTFWTKFKKALGPIVIALTIIIKFFAKLKLLVLPLLKFLPLLLKSGGTMVLMIWVYAMMWGWKFGVGFVLLLLIHECGHLVVARKFGLKAGAPVFIPFLGAFIALKDAPKNAWVEACVGIGGPILGTVGALACNFLGQLFNAPLFTALAWFGYFLNLFNLTPVGMLDGGRIVSALSRWLWIPGFAVLVWFGWKYPNFIVWLLVLASLPRVFSLFRKRTEDELRYGDTSR
jgi:Zn-dependent protease